MKGLLMSLSRRAFVPLPIALAAVLGSQPAGAAVQLFAEGVGSAATPAESYSKAFAQAQAELLGSCAFTLINKRITSAISVRTGTSKEFAADVKMSAICA
jgi:hypothetical protein